MVGPSPLPNTESLGPVLEESYVPPMSVEAASALLGIAAGAPSGEIRLAYRQRVMEVHPDRNGGVLPDGVDLHQLRRARDVLLEFGMRMAWGG